MSRDCECPSRNPDCEHPTCPRWPQPGHLRGQFMGDLAAVVGQNSLGAFAVDLDRLLGAYAAAELRAAADVRWASRVHWAEVRADLHRRADAFTEEDT